MWASCAFWSLIWGFVLLFRRHVTPTCFHHQAALRLLDTVRQVDLQVANSAIALLVSRDEGETVARAQVCDERIERLIQLFRFVTQDLASRFVCQFLNIDIWRVSKPAKASGPTHHTILRYLLGCLR